MMDKRSGVQTEVRYDRYRHYWKCPCGRYSDIYVKTGHECEPGLCPKCGREGTKATKVIAQEITTTKTMWRKTWFGKPYKVTISTDYAYKDRPDYADEEKG